MPTTDFKKPVYEVAARRIWFLDVAEVWLYRHLAVLLAWRSVRIRYKQTVLGLLWAVVTPVAYTALFVLFFGLLSVQASEGLPYVPTAFAGIILWQFLTRGLIGAGASLTQNANLITKVYFPRAVLPIAAAASAVTDLLINLVLLTTLLLWYGMPVGFQILLAPLFVLQTFVLVVGLGFWLSAVDGLFRDVTHAVPLLLQIGMFISPVVYTTGALVPGRWYWLYQLNPMVVPLEGFRWSVIAGAPAPNGIALIISLGVTFAFLCSGAMFFSRVERKIVDLV
jgi:homopolymeric O-antigen transport system permease protein